jgi:hypothetical protein
VGILQCHWCCRIGRVGNYMDRNDSRNYEGTTNRMTMPRRFFTSLAARYDKLRPPVDTPEYELWIAMVAGTVTTIQGEWQSFNRDRFLDEATGSKKKKLGVPLGTSAR